MSIRSQFAMFRWVVRRDLLLAWRRRADVLADVFFFVIIISLFPLSVSPEPELLRSMAPGIIWVATLLASLSCLDRLFKTDYIDGTLEQMLLTPQSVYLIVLGKVCAQIIFTGIPLILTAPVLGVQLGLSAADWRVLVTCLMLGIPVFLLIGSIAAALTLGLRGGSVLVSLLSLPLFIPALAFGAGALQGSSSGRGSQSSVLLLAALFVLTSAFAPCATAAALRISLE
jgi:heme exporter protein B